MSLSQQNPLSMLSQSTFRPPETKNVVEGSSRSDHSDAEGSFEYSLKRAESERDVGDGRTPSEAQQAHKSVEQAEQSAGSGEKIQAPETRDHAIATAKGSGNPPTDTRDASVAASQILAVPPEARSLDTNLSQEAPDLEDTVVPGQCELPGVGHDSELPGPVPGVAPDLESKQAIAGGADPLLNESLPVPVTATIEEDVGGNSLAPQEEVLVSDDARLTNDSAVPVSLPTSPTTPESSNNEAHVEPDTSAKTPVVKGLSQSVPAPSPAIGASRTNPEEVESMREALNASKAPTTGNDTLTVRAHKADPTEVALTPNPVTRTTTALTLSSSTDEQIIEAATEETKVSNLKSPSTARPDNAVVLQSSPSQSVSGGRVAIPVTVQFGNERWSENVAQNSAKLVMGNIQTAQLQLDPPELGPLTIKIHVHQDQASVSFVANNAAVKEALDATMVRLRDLLSEQGMTLADANVSDQSQQRSRQGHGEARGQSVHSSTEFAGEEPVRIALSLPSGIDYFV